MFYIEKKVVIAQAIAHAKLGLPSSVYVNVFKRETSSDSNESLGFMTVEVLSEELCIFDNQEFSFEIGDIIHNLFSCGFDEDSRKSVTSAPVYQGGELVWITRDGRSDLVFKDPQNCIVYIKK